MPTLYEFLTTNTELRVIDCETTLHDGLRHVVAVAIVEVNDGQLGDTHSWLVKPSVPIDPASRRIHGISDEDVADCPSFYEVSEQVREALLAHNDNSRLVWVSHNNRFDIPVLHGEFERSVTLWPDVAVLDTMTLPKHTGDPQVTGWALPDMARFYGVEGLVHHDPVSDARTSALLAVEMLHRATGQGLLDLNAVLAVTGDATTVTLTSGKKVKSEPAPEVHPVQTDEHVAAHPQPLGETPDKKQVKEWAVGFINCCLVGCEHAHVLARQLNSASSSTFQVVTRQALRLLPAGSVGVNTFLGAVREALWAGVVAKGQLLTWWVRLSSNLTPRACVVGNKCPDCREGRACPADVSYQSVARVLAGVNVHGFVPVSTVTRQAGSLSQLASWTTRGCADVAGFVAWLCLEEAFTLGDLVAAGKLHAHVQVLKLDEVQPRLALSSATRMLADGRKGAAQTLVENLLAAANTDPSFDLLREFQAGHLLSVPEPVERPVKTKRRYGSRVRRPSERVAQPRFKIV